MNAVAELEIIVAALNELPAKCRQAFLLHRIDGLTNEQVAHVLDIPEPLAHRYIIETITHCVRRLQDKQDERTAAH